jgi:hypothetical protein
VLYNGVKPYPDEAVIKLSDLYPAATVAPELDLTVQVYNINTGHNEARLRKSENLGGYSAFIDKVREFEAQTSSLDQAMKKAVNWCIEHGVLPEFLKTNGSEVVNMLLTEWNMDKALEVRGREAWEEAAAHYEARIADDQQRIADDQRRIAELERQLAGRR